MSKYLTSFGASNIPDNQPLIIRGTVALCRVANYWPADPDNDRQYPQQSLYLENPQIIPWILEQPNSPDYNDACMQANCMVNVITTDKVKMNNQGHAVYRWNNTVYQNSDGSTPPQTPLLHRLPNGELKQLTWDHDLAPGVQVEMMVTPKLRGKSGKQKIAQIGNYIMVNQPEVAWYSNPSTQFAAEALGLDPSKLQITNIPLIYSTEATTQPNAQQAQPNVPQANNTYGQPNVPQVNNAYGQPNVPQANNAYGQPNVPQANNTYGQPNVPQVNNAYGQPNVPQVNNAYGQPNVPQANNAYGQPNVPQANNAYGQPNVPQANNAYGQPNVPQAQPYNQQSYNQPSENFMNVPESDLPFN